MVKHLRTPFLCFLVLGLMSCAGSGQLASSNTRTYNKNIQIINNYFLQIIKNSSRLLIEGATRSQKSKSYTIGKRVGLDSNASQSDNSGRIKINLVNKNKTKVEIVNPDYPFGYPSFKK